MALTAEVRDVVRRLDVSAPVYGARSLEESIHDVWWFYRLLEFFFSLFGVVSMVLAGLGVYSVLAFFVRRRTAEVAVRMAMGAEARDILRLMVRQGLSQVTAGLVLGLALAAGLAHLLRSQFFGVQVLDPVTFGTISVLLIVTGALAALLPAWRATRVHPVTALRYE